MKDAPWIRGDPRRGECLALCLQRCVRIPESECRGRGGCCWLLGEYCLHGDVCTWTEKERGREGGAQRERGREGGIDREGEIKREREEREREREREILLRGRVLFMTGESIEYQHSS